MPSVRHALFFSFAEKYAATAFGIVATMVLSRIMTPADIGIFSVAASASIILAHVRDFGVPSYLIQERDLDDVKFQSAFTVSIAVALAIASVLYLGSFWLADYYGEPGIRRVIHVTVLSLVFIPFNSQVLITLRREMRFDAILRITVAGAFCHAVTSITLAELGAGYMSMAWANVANNLGSAVVAYFYRSPHYRFGLSFQAWRPVVSLGIFTVGANLLEDISVRSADLIIGKLINLNAVGLFSRGSGLNNYVNQAIVEGTVPVALSAFAREHRDGGDVKRAYLAAASRLSVFTWPAFLFAASMAYPIIRILFGTQWDAAVPVAQFLLCGAAFTSVKALHPPLYQSIGRTRSMFWVQVVVAPLQIGAFVLAASYGLVWVAVAASALSAVELALSQLVINRMIGLSTGELLEALVRSVVVTLAALAFPIWVLHALPPSPDLLWPPLLLGGAGALAGWLAALKLVRHPMATDVVRIGQSLRRQPSAAIPQPAIPKSGEPDVL